MSKVKIKNTSGYRISIILDNVRYRRDLNPGQETVIPEDVFEEFNFDNGCRNYMRNGFLKVIAEDVEIKEQLPEIPEDVDMDADDVVTNKSIAEFTAILKNASPAMKEKIVAAAIKNSTMDAPKVALIKNYCNVDVLQALNLQRSMN